MIGGSLPRWRALLSSTPHLSERFKERNARLLALASEGAHSQAVDTAEAIAALNPRQAAQTLLGLSDASRSSGRSIVDVGGSGEFATTIQTWLTATLLDDRLQHQPALQRTRVPIHPDRRATRVPDSPAGPLVAVAWSGASVPAREENRRRIADALAQHRRDDVDDDLIATAPDTYAIATMSTGDAWSFAPDYGATVEDELRAGGLSRSDRAMLVDTLARVRSALLDAGVVWQGFAPRNMFRVGGDLVLIDFEACADVDLEPVVAAQYLAWHTVFFADCLTDEEASRLFAPHPRVPSVSPDTTLPADPFERALLGVAEVTWGDRAGLLKRSARLEGRHLRPCAMRDGGVLFGHELGHFWGDFVPVETEVEIFSVLDQVEAPVALVACLEVFEGAMEADIDSMLLSDATQTPASGSARTKALTEVLSSVGPETVASVRRDQADWYERLVEAPARLVDHVLAQIHESGADNLAREYLVGDQRARSAHAHRLHAAVDVGMRFAHGDDRGDRFLNHSEPDELLKLAAEPLPASGSDFDAVLAEAEQRFIAYSISQAHRGYLAFPDSGNAVAAVAGSMLTRLLNQNLIAVDRSAPSATFVTVQVIEWLRELVGYETMPLAEFRGVKDVAGVWTTGGHMSNHMAMLTALGHRFPEARQRGLRALDTEPIVIMAGPIAHYSHSDAGFHLGLGWDAVRHVPARPDYTTDPEAIEAMLTDPPDGTTPFMVIGVAGNCRTTGLDDLASIADVCARHGVWFHADACHGGSLLFSERRKRECLTGIDQADSVSLDPHKGLFTPYPSSYVLFRQRGVLNQFSRHVTTVEEDGCWDLGLITPFFGSVGFEALPTWMLLKHLGTERLGELVESRHALVRHLQRRLDDTALFVRLNDVDFYRLAWVFCPPAVQAACRSTSDPKKLVQLRTLVSDYTARLNDLLYRRGQVCFDEHTLADLDDRVGMGAGAKFTIMASCPGNPLTTFRDIDRAVDDLVATARSLTDAMIAALDGEHAGDRRRLAGPAGWADQ